jgi:hypothetical protein
LASVLVLGLEFLGTGLLVHLLSLVLLEEEPGLAVCDGGVLSTVLLVTMRIAEASLLGDDPLLPLAALLAQDHWQLLDGTDEEDGNVNNPPSGSLCTCTSLGSAQSAQYAGRSQLN